jgi:hypothetical protein
MTRIEEHVLKAIEEGSFDDLPGKGQPLNMVENPLEDPEWRLANHVLRSSGYTLPWIEERREILTEIDAVRLILARVRKARMSPGSDDRYSEKESEWQRYLQAFYEQVELLNKRIANYNLQAPSINFHLRKLDAEKEIHSILDNPGEAQE